MADDRKETRTHRRDEVQAVCAFSSRKVAWITLLILSLVGLGRHPVWADDGAVLHLQWYHQFQFAGYYAAQEKGFFQEEGLEVTIVEGGPGTENFEAVLSAPGQYATAHAAGFLLHRADGEPLIALASVFQHSPNAIIGRADRGIRSPHDLVAERTIIWPGGHVELSAMLLREGVDPSPFLREANGNHLLDLLEGRIDAIDGYVTNEAIAAREAGVPFVIISPINYGVDFYGDVLITSERELRESPDRAKAFRAASLRGWEYAMAHPQEIVDLIVSKYSAKPGREHLLSEAEATKALVLSSLIEIGHANPGRWQRMADTLVELNLAKSGIQAEDFLFDPNPHTDLKKVYIGIGIGIAITAAIGVFALVLIYLNRLLRREILERKRAEEDLREREGLLREAQRIAGLGCWKNDLIKHNLVWSPGTLAIFGWEQDAAVNLAKFIECVHPEDVAALEAAQRSALTERRSIDNEYRIIRADGAIRVLHERGEASFDDSGNPLQLIGIVYDITERKRAEERIADSLREKEVLLREIHHRVKNNMQVIVSLLRMYSRRIDDARLRQAFDDCRDRVTAMSMIHQALYQSEDLARIDFNAYLTKLCRNLSRAHRTASKGIAVTVGPGDVSLGMDQGVAVGMVVCELVSNAFKHAFSEGETGSVFISLSGLDEGEIELIVEDEGCGLPAEIDVLNPRSLGLDLAVTTVTAELGGSVEVERDGGTRFIIRFKSKTA